MSEMLMVSLIVATAALYAVWRLLPVSLTRRLLSHVGWSQQLADAGSCGSCNSCKGCRTPAEHKQETLTLRK